MTNITDAFRVDTLSLGDNILMVGGSIDPSIDGYEAPIGSLYFDTTQHKLFSKTGITDTNWVILTDHGNLTGLSDYDHPQYVKKAGDSMSAPLSLPSTTPLQQSVNLNLEIINDWIVPSANGTHGFADPTKIALLPRTFSKDGNWDWDGYNLTPNLNGNGAYKISYIDRTIHRFVNNVSCRGICETWSPLQSNETTELPSRYVLDIIATNTSNSTWGVDVLIEVYREKNS